VLVLLAGVCLFQFLEPRRPRDDRAGPEAPQRSAPASAPSSAGDARKDSHALASPANARSDDGSPVPAKTPAQKSIVAQRDPTLDAWFVAAYLRCWTPPPAPTRGEKYAAEIRVVHNADGSFASAPLLVNPPTDPQWRAYADSAVSAVAKCPLQIPAPYLSRFGQWRKMTLHFAPDGAL
jgi:hypothetical protein